MGTTLTGTTPQDTYDSLIKVTDNGPLTGSLKKLTDGLGNDSSLSLSTTAASLSGTLAVTGATTLTAPALSLRVGNATGNSGANILIAGASTTKNWSLGVQQNVGGGLEFTPTATNGATTLGISPAMVILDAGNVGIAKTNPSNALHIAKAASSVLLDGLKVERDPSTTTSAIFNAFGGAANIVSNSGVTSSFTAPIVFALSDNTTTTEIARITSNGLTFNGDTAAANALDDYEEGTFSPTIIGTTTAGTATYTEQNGRYTKIGRLVQFEIYMVYTAGTGTGNLRISNLPFTIGGLTYAAFSIGAFDAIAMTALTFPLCFGLVGSSQIYLGEMPVGGGSIQAVAYDAAGGIQIAGTYSV